MSQISILDPQVLDSRTFIMRGLLPGLGGRLLGQDDLFPRPCDFLPGASGIFLHPGDLAVHTRQGPSSLVQSGLPLLLLFQSRREILVGLEKLFLRLEELLLKKREPLPTAPRRMNKA